MHLLSFMCLLWPVLTILARQCGCPGTPEKGTVVLKQNAYNEGDRVTYTCNNGYYFKNGSKFRKKAQRICQDTGNWTGTVPACNYRDVIYNANITPERLHSITDEGDDDSCAKVNIWNWNESKITAHFEIGLTGSIQILVRLEKGGLPRQTTMYVQMDYANQCSPASFWEQGISDFASICNRTASNANGGRVSLKFHTSSQHESSVSICSFKGLVHEAPGCKELDCPAYGTVSYPASNIATYKCAPEYEILGEPQRECVWSYNRRTHFWTGTAPVCAKKIHTDDLPIVPNECPICPDYNITSVQCFPEFTLGTDNHMADCNCLTNWTWKLNLSLPTTNEMMCASPFLNTSSTSLALIIIAVIITIFNILYCLVHYGRKKPTTTGTRPKLEVNNQPIYQNQDVREEPEVLPLNSLSRDGRNLPANNGRCSMNEQRTYAEIGEPAIFSTTQSTTAQHLSKSKEPCFGANEGGRANAKIPVQQHSSSIEPLYASLNSHTKNNPAKNNAPITHYFKNDEPYAQVRKSGKFQSDGPEPRLQRANQKSDYSEPSYINVPKKT